VFFRIADFLIEIGKIKKISAPFNLFQVKDNSEIPDIKISIEDNCTPCPKNKKLIFKTQNCWELHQWQNKIIFWDRFNGAKLSSDSRFAVFDKKLSRGKLHLYRSGVPHKSALGRNPLSYPIGPLILLSKLSQRKEGIFLHASGIKDSKGNGYIFCGHSGAGKSTMARLWSKNKKGTVLNDDRLIIREKGEDFLAYGCPWYVRDKNLVSNVKIEVKKIFFLSHNPRNYLKPLTPKEAFLRVIRHAYFPFWDKSSVDASFGFLKKLCQKIDCFELGFRPTKKVINFIRQDT